MYQKGYCFVVADFVKVMLSCFVMLISGLFLEQVWFAFVVQLYCDWLGCCEVIEAMKKLLGLNCDLINLTLKKRGLNLLFHVSRMLVKDFGVGLEDYCLMFDVIFLQVVLELSLVDLFVAHDRCCGDRSMMVYSLSRAVLNALYLA